MSPEIEPLAVLFAAALVLSLGLTRAARALAPRLGLVDRPDGRRKIHRQATPAAGGIAVFASAVTALGLAAVATGPLGVALREGGRDLAGLLLGSAVICLVGVLDDACGLRGAYKLLGQVAAVAVVVVTGTQVEEIHVFSWQFRLGWLGVPFTCFWLLGAVNSLNLLDGMDGLLGVVGTVVCAGVAALAALQGRPAEAAVALALAGALVGFLRYNLPPASIFLGDAGSMTVGLVVGVLAIRCSLKGPATVALAAPAALLTLPIFDTAAALVRRKLTGRSIYTPDRGHLHHCLLRTGLSRTRVLVIVSALSTVTALGALASTAYQSEGLAILAAGAVVTTLVATRLFGHTELMLLVKSWGAWAWWPGEPPTGRQIEVRLQGSAGWGILWAELTGCASRLNLRSMTLDVNAPSLHEGYHARWHRPGPCGGEGPGHWSAVLPLTAWGQTVGQLAVTGQPDGDSVWHKLTLLAGVTGGVEPLLARAMSAPRPVTPVRVRPLAGALVGAEPE
jgi:UDP-GlcNAc:undecaprenyl-phosphate GlcNAc-1-phosphate transferase